LPVPFQTPRNAGTASCADADAAVISTAPMTRNFFIFGSCGINSPRSIAYRDAVLLRAVAFELLDANRSNEPGPARDVVLDESAKLRRSIRRRRLHADRDQSLLQIGPRDRALHLAIELLDDIRRRARGGEQPAPSRHVERRIARLDHG